MSIEFELTRDARLLAQYYALREQCFRQDLGIPDFDGSEDEADRQQQILIARVGDRCIAGARISSRLPIENQLRELALSPHTCCMWERLVIDPAVRCVQLALDFCAQLIEYSRKTGYHYALILSSLRNARFYRQCHSSLGVGFKIHRDVPDCAQGAFADLEHYLSVAHLRKTAALSLAA